ncbi:MAG: hypothetical protein CML04_02430 [Pseudozobellia sp.]|nr:hypothetical protein [Pseudozobellia sp.]MBG46968.1 hypothetical protein [Pseudozobellia sp.]|tara:strand:- start:433548 stop:433922 length:375 start_codon:yes stop_codon:yes gene_type:complete
MTAALIGIAFGIGIPLLTELLRFDKRTIGALTLTAIAFIYIGFVATNFPELYIEAIGALVFFMLAYFGLTKKPMLIPLGLFLHGLWDIGHLLWENASFLPEGYEILCIAADTLLTIYFYTKLRK